jgi:hypothetical protein
MSQPLIAARNFAHAELTLPPSFFAPAGDADPTSRLLGTLYINATAFHVMAYAVHETDEGLQEFVGDFVDEPEAVYTALAGDGAWQTIMIDGREYVLVITPHCS